MSRYHIIELFSAGKCSDELNEDGWIATPHYVAVIDGSTSKGNINYGSKKSGKLAMELIKEAIQLMPPELSAFDAARYLSQPIFDYYKAHNLLQLVEEHPENRMTASVVIYSTTRNEVWHIGDCFCLIDDLFIDNPKYWEYPLAQSRSLFIEQLLASGKTTAELQKKDEGRAYILTLLKFSMRYQNNETTPQYAYAVIDGFTIPQSCIKVTPVHDARQIVLSSDGYMHLYPTLQQSEQFNIDRLKEDPLCIKRCKMTKGLMWGNQSFDDRTYLRIEIE